MKKFLFTLLSFSLLLFSSCQDDDNMLFFIDNSNEDLVIANDFLPEYLISPAFANNVAERLVWTHVDFGVPSNVTYELYGSIDATMTEQQLLGSTSQTNIAIMVNQLLSFARDLDLDDDPLTTNEDGLPNDAGQVYFRLKAFVGSGLSEDGIVWSDIYPMNIRMIERQGEGDACPSYWVVGAGAPDAGWGWASPIEFICNGNVFSARLRLDNDNFRFFTSNGDWDSGLNYGYFASEGYDIDELLVSVEDGDNNFGFVGTPGIYDMVVNANNKTITLTPASDYYLVGDGTQAGWGWDNPVVATQVAPYVYEASVTLNTAGAFRVFTVRDDWGSGLNFPHYEAEGYTIDSRFTNANDGDSNFKFTGTAGTFTMRIDEKEKTIVLE